MNVGNEGIRERNVAPNSINQQTTINNKYSRAKKNEGFGAIIK